MSRWSLAFTLARRELRAGLAGFGAFLACIALGVAAIAAVGVVNASVVDAVKRDAAKLLGGDLAITVASFPLEPDELERATPDGARLSEIVTTTALVSGAERQDGGKRRAVLGVKAVDDAYPLIGEALLEPQIALDEALAGNGVVMERVAAQRLGIEVGETFEMGGETLELRAILVQEPDAIRQGFINVGPRALMRKETLDATGALAPGAVARFGYRFDLPDGADVGAALAAIREAEPDARYRVRTASSIQPQVQRFTDRLSAFLTLSGFTALLVGGLGVALGVSGHLASKNATIATMKCLGAEGRLVFDVYFVQIALLTALGVAIGLILGQTLPFVLPALVPPGALPIRLAVDFQLSPLIFAAACGFLAAFAFTVPALSRAGAASPAALFRAIVQPARRTLSGRDAAILGGCVIGLALLALIGVERPSIGYWYLAIAAIGSVVLWGVGRLAVGAVARFARSGGPFMRMAIGGVAKPGSSAVPAVTATGAGLAALAAVGLLETILSNEVDQRLSAQAPSLVLIDVQADQKEALDAMVEETEGAEYQQVQPVTRARVSEIAGVDASEAVVRQGSRWTVRRERGLTWTAEPWDLQGRELTEGSWWPADYDGPPLVSIEDEVAFDYGVGIGDTITFDIFGRSLEAEIANLRPEIDWGSGRMDFVFVLSPGALDDAPHVWLASLAASEEATIELIDRIAETMPNVTPLDIGELASRIGETMARIGLAIKIVGGVTLLAGAFVLAGAAAAERRRRMREAVILKVLGATRGQVLRAFGLEFSLIGLIAATIGLAIGVFSAWLAATQLLNLEWSFDPTTALLTIALALGLALLVGARTIWSALGVPAAEALRVH